MSIRLSGIAKRFGNFVAVNDVDLDIETGELVALLGPSGSGKTTLLRIIAGLEAPDRGAVVFHGEDTTARHARERQVGFVFQHYALFPHMSVFENVAFGLRVRRRDERLANGEIAQRVQRLLDLVQLAHFADRFPHQLSGGQRQRIALARALAVEPKVLLLDEPFGALDARVRKELRQWLRRLHDEVRVTTVFVTHDQEEALEVADRIVVMNHGAIEQVGAPEDVYDHPATPFVLQFLGQVNRIPHAHDRAAGDMHAYARPHDIAVLASPAEGAHAATLERRITIGAWTRLQFQLEAQDHPVQVELPREHAHRLELRPGDKAWLQPRRVRHFAAS